MCLRVDANGWGNGAGTHVSVHVFFMNAEYVPWMMNELNGESGRNEFILLYNWSATKALMRRLCNIY